MDSSTSLVLGEDIMKVMASNLEKARTVKIPMVIMQTWKNDHIPSKWKASQRAIKRHMPEWNYILMTDKDNLMFVTRHFPDFLHYFKSFEYPIQRADAIRYMWLYVNGGIYLDLDLEIMKPMDDLFYEDKDLYVVKSSMIENVYTNAFMASKPGLRVMLQCLDEMKAPYAVWHIGKHLKVVNSTGPNMFTTAINKVKADVNVKLAEMEANGEFIQRSDKFMVRELQSELIVACSVCDPKPCCTEGGYCRILGGSSWSGNDTELLTFLYCNRYKLIVMLIVVIAIIAIVIIYVMKKRRARLNISVEQ